MYPAAFEYHAPTNVKDVLGLLGRYKDDAKLLAGGHSLVPMMKLRLAQPKHLIDLRKVPGLSGIKEEGSALVLGAMTSLHPQMGLAFVIDAFIVIVIGGLGSFKGAIVGSLLLGQVQSFGVALLPEFTNPLVFLVMAIVLIVRPTGLFGGVPRHT